MEAARLTKKHFLGPWWKGLIKGFIGDMDFPLDIICFLNSYFGKFGAKWRSFGPEGPKTSQELTYGDFMALLI